MTLSKVHTTVNVNLATLGNSAKFHVSSTADQQTHKTGASQFNKPIQKTTNQPILTTSTNQSKNNQLTNQPTIQPTNQATNQQANNQPTNKQTTN